jgi:hypothetical protein
VAGQPVRLLHRPEGLGGTKTIHVVFDGFNIFNTNTPTNMSVYGDGYGRVDNIPQGRRFRFGARFQF